MPDQKQNGNCRTASGPDIMFYIFEWRAAGSAAFRREMYIFQHPLGKLMKAGRRACSPNGFRSFPRGGQAAKPLCPPTTRNAERSESGVLNGYVYFSSATELLRICICEAERKTKETRKAAFYS